MRRTILIGFTMMLLGTINAEAQIFKKLKKVAEQAAERTIEERVERETTEKTDQILDSILSPGKGETNQTEGSIDDWENEGNEEVYEEVYEEENDQSEPGGYDSNSSGNTDPSIEIYSKFDFVPGDKQLFFDDFGNDFVGDFPSKWNTNGSGEIVSVGNNSDKWFEMKPGLNVYYIPDISNLPKDFTIEFDLLATGLDHKTASTTVFKIFLADNNGFDLGKYAYAQMSFCQYAPVGLWVRNDQEGIMNEVGADIRESVLNQPHISMAVNGQRFRLWINEKKVIDIPRLISKEVALNGIKFQLVNFKDGKERLFIRNLKVAEGGPDLRRTLIANGKVSTNGILFESGSDQIRPQSMGVIRQIYQVLQQAKSLQLSIVGHTDADGDERANMNLSLLRAKAVKNVLTSVYGIDSDRLQTDGKGESEPVGDNATLEGKSQNRRVEFVKI